MAELLRYTQEWHQQQQDIHPSDYIEETAEHNEIAELSSSLLALFKEVVLALSKQAGIPRDARISIERSCSALILWSDGFGIAQGRLNDTFNKSRKLRYTSLKNLLHIGRVLVERLVPAVNISSEKLKTLCSSVELNIETAAALITEESCRQSDDSSSDAASNFSDDDIYEIAEDLRTDTLVLSGLDPLLKYPIFDSQHEHIIESHALPTWGPEKSYSDKIGNRFPHADVSLTLYLGRANYERFLRCQEAREFQEEEESLPMVNQEEGTNPGTIMANTKFHDSGVGTSIALTMSYAETTMSYNHDGQSVRIPPLPKEAKSGSPFTCIACGRTVIITNNSAWKQHIYIDLQPYMCLDLSCPYSSTTFESRDKWIAHLALDHEMEPKWASAECPLCREETGNGKIAITKHLSKHLEEVSLSALPVEVDSDAESENSPESSDASSSRDEETYAGIDENGETLSVKFKTELAAMVFSNLADKLKAERNHEAQSEAKRGVLQKAADILAASEAENMAAQLKRTQENIEEMFRKKGGYSKMAKLLSPIIFTDAVGRRFNFPVHLCYTWQEMEDLIRQAFSQVDILGPHVQAGHYDLTGPDGKIILPSLWEETVEPGLHITMTMWPLDKAPLAGLGLKESEQPHDEEGNSEKDSISSKQQQGAQHSENVQGARIIRMSGQNFFDTVKTYFKDQPDKLTRFRVILADITTTEWVPEAWQRSCFECRVAEAECDAKGPDPCTRCRLKKLSCAVQFAAVSRQHTVVNSDQIHQGIINIGRLCGGFPSFMHELNSVMPTGYRVEVPDALTVRLFEPHDKQPTIIQVGISEPPGAIVSIYNQGCLDTEPNSSQLRLRTATTGSGSAVINLTEEPDSPVDRRRTQAAGPQVMLQQVPHNSAGRHPQRTNSQPIPGTPSRPTLANQNSSEAAITQQEETSHYFAQPTESRRTADHPAIDTMDEPELAHIELKKTAESYADRIEQRFIGSPHISGQLLEILRDAQNGTRSTENAYMVAKELFSLNSDLMDEFQRELTKLDVDLLQKLRSALNNISEGPGEAVEIKGDNVRTQEVVATVKDNNGPNDPDEPQYCLCNKGSVGIMIRCDNVDSCKHKWFHLECVGLAVAPSSKEKWYCTDCRGHVNIGTKEEINSQGLPTDSGNLEFAIDTEMSSLESSEIRNLANMDGHGPLELDDALSYLDKVKNRFLDKPEIYEQFLQILKTFKEDKQKPTHEVSTQDVYAQVTTLFSSVPDLLEGFKEFLPRSFRQAQAPPSLSDDIAGADTTVNLTYLEGLAKFHKQQGNNLNRLPYVDKKPVDLYRLKNLVESRGGFDKVCRSKEWAEIAKDLGYSGRIMSSLSTSLKNSFLRWLSPYEEYLRAAKPGDDHHLEEEHVDPRNKGKEIPSIGRINYDSPNPDIYIWPPESNVPGEEESEPARSPTIAPPLPPPVMEATVPVTDRVKSSTVSELSSTPSDKWKLSSWEDLDLDLFSVSPLPSIYTEQLPPIPGVLNGGKSALIDSLNETSSLRTSPPVPSSSFAPPVSSRLREIQNRVLPCEAEPPERRLCFQRFADNKARNRHYWVYHKDYAKERGIQSEMTECTICGIHFIRRDNFRRHIRRHHSIHQELGVAGQDAVRASSEDLRADTVNAVTAEARGSHDERDREFSHNELGAQVARESDVQDRNVSPNDEYMQAQAQAQAHGQDQSSAAHNDDLTIKVSGQAIVKISGAQIECDGGEITISTNSAAGASPGSGMPGASRAVNDKESTVYQAQAQAQAQHQAQEPQQAHSNATLQVQMQAHARLVYDRLMEVAADQFSGPENVPQETVDKIKHESYAQAQQLVKDLVQQRAQQQQQQQQQQKIIMQQQREQKAAMQAMDGIEVARSEKEGSIQGNKGATQVKDASSPPLESIAPVIGSTLNRPHNDISSLKTEQKKAEDDLGTFADYFDGLEDEIPEDENKMQERERKWEEWEDIVKSWENKEPNPETSAPYPGTLGMEEEKPFNCETCGKRYKNLNGLKYHKSHSLPCNPEFKLV